MRRKINMKIKSKKLTSTLLAVALAMALTLFAATPLMAQALAPAKPTDLTAEAGEFGVTLTWKNNETNAHIVYIQSKVGSGAWAFCGNGNTLSGPATRFLDSQAKEEGQTYSYRVCAVSGNLEEWSEWSNEVSITRGVNAATNLTATAVGSSITLNWTDNSQIEEVFSIYKKEGAGSFTRIFNAGANVKTYTDNNVSAGKTYTYQVFAVKTGISGAWSNEATVTMTIAVAPAITKHPENQTVAEGGNTSVTVVATGSDLTYQWQVSTDGGTIFSPLADISNSIAGATSATLRVMNVQTEFNGFKVRCVVSNAGGIFVTSNAATLTVTTGAPTITGPTTMTLTAGYAATSTGVYTVTGTPAPTVTKQSGNAAILWNDSAKKLEIGTGLTVGTYPVVLKASNGVNPDAELTFTLTVTAASTTGSMDNFQKVNTYTPGMFTDVNENAWYGFYQQKVIASAYEYGLMKGNSATTFNPTGNMTIAEAITVAARVHSIYMTSADNFTQGNPWYKVYVDYAIDKGIITASDFSNYTVAATRVQMAYIFSKALPQTEFASQNTVNSLPDVNSGTPYYSAIITLYEAGVVGGSDSAGTFNPSSNINRAEAAAIISRVILPSTRFSGKTYQARKS
jgi:fibronectin type 3 domain-containing protein